MHCDKCGKENRENSKFCRSCGVSLAEETTNPIVEKKSIKEFKIDWKNPVVLLIIGLIIALGLFWGGSNVYGYFKVSSKINKAEKLLISKDYVGSLETLNSLEFGAGTVNQKQEITKLKEDNKKFPDYKTLFDTTVAKISATSTVTDLKQAQKDLQSIDSTYPDYESVKTKLTEIGGLLMTALENDSAASKALAEKNRQAALAAQAAKDRAEQNAQTQANIAKGEEVQKAFRNELTNAYNSYTQGSTNYGKAIGYSNDSEHLLAISMAGTAAALLDSAYEAVSDLNTRYTNMPSTYYSATNNLLNAIDNLNNAISLLIKSEGTSLDYSSSINTYKNNAYSYAVKVKSFIDATAY